LLRELDPADARRACELLMDTLVELHDVDPDSVGLADFGRPEGFLARQVARWHKQWQASETRPLDVLGQTVERLSATVPEQSAPAIVHGDYRLTNVMFTLDVQRIAAVVDWEMATLGDPLTDLGLLVVYQDLAQQGDAIMPRMLPERGFLTSSQMISRYAERSPRDLARLSWYVGFGYFKLAVVAEGIHRRYLAGMTVGAGFDHFGDAVPMLLDAALRALAQD
jgi:aminoglycoside phosphotransferase (APT) family kinase protein